MKKIGVIGVPSSAGARRTGQERAVKAFRQASLIEQLRSAGFIVNDYGDLPEVVFRPDRQNPRSQNLQLVVSVANQVTDRVQTAALNHEFPLVLGGDCSMTFGVLSGLVRQSPNLGLLYLDGDVDLNTPDTTLSGVFDGMIMAHIVGNGADALARNGPRYPLMNEESIVLFGYSSEAGGIDPVESRLLEQSRMMKYPLSLIGRNVRESAKDALTRLEKTSEAILVHFDVDVIDFDDFPAADLPHHKGMKFDDAIDALRVFMASPKVAGLVVAEFNADRDTDGSLATRLVHALVGALEGQKTPTVHG